MTPEKATQIATQVKALADTLEVEADTILADIEVYIEGGEEELAMVDEALNELE